MNFTNLNNFYKTLNHLPWADKLCLQLATLFGVSYTPLMPGTASCLIAVIMFMLIRNQFFFLFFTLISVILAYKYSSRAEELFNEKDCKRIVIDDFSGMLVTYLFIPYDFRFIISGFFLFRMLDMLKIPPANKLERLPGARGIVGDDMAAGIYANILLHLVNIIIK